MSAVKMFAFVLAFAMLPAGSKAQVYKCVDAGGASYQSDPCPEGQATERTWEAAGYAPPSAIDVERVERMQQATARRDASLRSPGRRGTSTRAVAGTSIGACEAARQKRDRELAAMGRAGRSIEVRRAADTRVSAASR